MNIEFERTQEDFVEFNLFHISHSLSIRQQVLMTQITMALLVIILSLSISFLRSHYLSPSDYVVGAIFGAIAYFGWPHIYKRSAIRQAQRMLNEGNNRSLLGHQEISLSSDGVFCKTRASESKLSWSAVDKVLQNHKYIFIYIRRTEVPLLNSLVC